jgi:hypothetical protein
MRPATTKKAADYGLESAKITIANRKDFRRHLIGFLDMACEYGLSAPQSKNGQCILSIFAGYYEIQVNSMKY